MPNPTTLREKIIKACPDILDLKFGCRITDGENTGRIPCDMKTVLDASTRGEYNLRPLGGEKLVEVWDDFYGLNYYDIDKVKILGRLIRLADVLRALRKKASNDKDNEWYYNAVDALVIGDEADYTDALWNLSDDDLDHQSAETVTFLATLLGE